MAQLGARFNGIEEVEGSNPSRSTKVFHTSARVRFAGAIVAYPVSPYIEERDDGLFVAGTRVSLDSVVIRFQEGASPEQIVQSFPTLKLSQVYGAIAYYLENEEAIKEYLAEGERELYRTVPPLSEQAPELFARLMAARKRIGSKRT